MQCRRSCESYVFRPDEFPSDGLERSRSGCDVLAEMLCEGLRRRKDPGIGKVPPEP